MACYLSSTYVDENLTKRQQKYIMSHATFFRIWCLCLGKAWSRCWNPGFPAMCFACLLLKYSGQEYDFFSLPRTTLLILSIIVEEANILPGLQLLLLPLFIMMFAATAEQAWTVNLLSAALYQSGLFLAVFKLLVNPFGLTHWLLVGISAGHELQVLQVADIVYPSMLPLTQKGCDCMLFTITNPLLLGDWESCPTSSAHFG